MTPDPAWTLRTARLVLEPVTAAHAADLIAFHADARVMRTMRHGPLDAEAARRLFAEYAAAWPTLGYGVRVLRRATDGAFLGICGLWEREDGRGIALRFAVAPGFQGQGYAREAAAATLADGFGRLGLARIVAVARAENAASRRALEAAGFTLESWFENKGATLALYVATRRAGLVGAAGFEPTTPSPPD